MRSNVCDHQWRSRTQTFSKVTPLVICINRVDADVPTSIAPVVQKASRRNRTIKFAKCCGFALLVIVVGLCKILEALGEGLSYLGSGEDDCGEEWPSSRRRINPASGLPMAGLGVDVGGNCYGSYSRVGRHFKF